MPFARRITVQSRAWLRMARRSRYGRAARVGAPYAVEIIYLAMQVVILASAAMVLSSMSTSFHNVYRNSMICLTCGVVVFHVNAYRNRKRFTKQVTRFIDYVYLGIGALGLLSASDFTVRTYREQARYVVETSLADLRTMRSVQANAQRSTCADDSQGQFCTTYKKIFRIAVDAEKLAPNESSIHLLKGLLNQLKKVADGSTYVSEQLKLYRQNPYEDLKSLESLDDEPFGYDASETPMGPNFLREFGFYLVASSLALRLTRVTIEVRGWA